MIECVDLIKIYEDEQRHLRVPALRGCDFHVEKGEFVSIIGPSGSGKTTLINILAGLESISSGTVRVAGISLERLSIQDLSAYRLKKVTLVDQFPERNLFLNVKVRENLSLYSTLAGLDLSSRIRQRNDKIMNDLGIAHLASRLTKTLSGGEKVRVAIACAIAKNTPVLLCDEPTGQLDTENTLKVKAVLAKVSKKYQTTVIVVTHDLRFLEGVDRTYIIKDGRVSAVLDKEDKLAQTKFPLQYKRYVDTSKSIRIPELIVKTLKIEDQVLLEMDEKSRVILKHPQAIPPEKISLEEQTTFRKELHLQELPKDYHKKQPIVLEAKNLSKIYKTPGGDVHALSNVNLRVHSGEFLFIVGPSGSGKSTLIKVLVGLEEETAGEIFLLNKPFNRLSNAEKALTRKEHFGIVMQQGNLHPFLTVEENLYLKDVFAFKQKSTPTISDTFTELLELFQIVHRRKSFPSEISAGELQRASLAVSFYKTPKILFLDEPTANLDSDLAKFVMENLFRLHREQKLTILLSTHDINLIQKGMRVIELVDGTIFRDGLLA
ncbi:MAG: ABC transporter ATP-binding protein [Candidatus Heimdallarchaeota archaeon]